MKALKWVAWSVLATALLASPFAWASSVESGTANAPASAPTGSSVAASASPSPSQPTTITFLNSNPAPGQPAKGLRFAAYPANLQEIITEGLGQIQPPSRTQGAPVHFSDVEVHALIPDYEIDDFPRFLSSGNLDAEATLSGYEYYFKTLEGKNGVIYERIDATSGAPVIRGARMNPATDITDAVHQASLLVPVQAGS